MPWKKDANGKLVEQDGSPVYVYADGKEVPFDGDRAVGKINELTTEAANRRTEAKTATERLAAFGDLDPEKARKGIEALANLDAKKLIDAGKVDELFAERSASATKAWEEKLAAKDAEVKAEQARVHKLIVGNRFATSKVIPEKTVIPGSVAEKVFGDYFKVEGESAVGYINGKPIYSRTKPGELADFEEAIGIVIESLPEADRNQILRSAESSGGGATGSTAAPAGKKRSDMTVAEKSAYIEKHGSEAYLALQ